MAKFNSLGSNYSLRQALKVLWPRRQMSEVRSRKQVLTLAGLPATTPVQLTWFYKGREALQAALMSLHLPAESRVGVVGFTCVAVAEAVQKAKLTVVILPIDETLNLDVAQMPTDLAAVIIQNTFGFPQPQMDKLKRFCQHYHTVIIEDLAHSAGARYDSGERAGSVGQEVVFSSSQDKILDTVSGGIWLSRQVTPETFISGKINLYQQIKDRNYPFFTWIIRRSYSWGLGKCLHFILKRLNLLSRPMTYHHHQQFSALPSWQKRLLVDQISSISRPLQWRRQVVKWYQQWLPAPHWWYELTDSQIAHTAPLRLPIRIDPVQRLPLLAALARAGYHFSDTWYDAPIGPMNYYHLLADRQSITVQTKKLTHEQRVCTAMINLPVHPEITQSDVKRICQIVTSYGGL